MKEEKCKCTNESEASKCSINCDYSNGRGKLLDINTTEGAIAYLQNEGLNVTLLVREGIDFIETVKKRIELQKRWMPITDTENYPKDHQQIFMCFENGDVAVGTFCDDVDASWWSDYFIDHKDAKITHWMPYEIPSAVAEKV